MYSLPRVIALCGKKRVGKDTLADYLVSQYGYRNVKFAEPLKCAVKSLFGFSDDQLEKNKEQVDHRWNVSPRHVLQFIGCDVMQIKIQELLPGIGREFLSKTLLEKYTQEHIVISDLRFVHEFNAIQNIHDSLVIKIMRDDVDDGDQHISETELNEIKTKYVIVNNGNIQKLCWEFDRILESHIKKLK